MMSGIFFNYEPGRIEAQFSHEAEFDYINLDLHVDGDTTISTECDDEFRPLKTESNQKDSADFQVYFSSVWCAFSDFIRFLEAITIEVQKCSFEWDPEGPHGVMRWARRYIQDTGFLTVEWHSSKNKFSHRIMLNTRQAVRTLYSAFRTFVESPDYDPIRYERLTYGECFALVLSNATLNDLACKLAQMDAATAETMFWLLRNAVSDRHRKGPKLSFTIEHFLGSLETAISLGEYDSWLQSERETESMLKGLVAYRTWIQPEWDSWDRDRRMEELKAIFDWESGSWYGANLRVLKSKLIEDWLALPEPLSGSNSRIPQ
jgi:hypothetical protein